MITAITAGFPISSATRSSHVKRWWSELPHELCLSPSSSLPWPVDRCGGLSPVTFSTILKRRTHLWQPYCSQTLLVHLFIGKPTASPQLRALRSYPYTLGQQVSVLFKSGVLSVRHKTHNTGPFTKPSVRGGRSLLEEYLSSEYPVSMHKQGDKRSFHPDYWEFEVSFK